MSSRLIVGVPSSVLAEVESTRAAHVQSLRKLASYPGLATCDLNDEAGATLSPIMEIIRARPKDPGAIHETAHLIEYGTDCAIALRAMDEVLP